MYRYTDDKCSRALEKLHDWVLVPIVKLGPKEAMLMSEGTVHRQPALPGAIVDATGAGDAFNGGFLHEFLRGGHWDDYLRAGNVCGSLAAMAPGGSLGLPTYPEFARHMRALKAQSRVKPGTRRSNA